MKKFISIVISFIIMAEFCSCTVLGRELPDLIEIESNKPKEAVILEPQGIDSVKDPSQSSKNISSSKLSKERCVQDIFSVPTEMSEVVAYLKKSKGIVISELQWFRLYPLAIDDLQGLTLIQYRMEQDKDYSYLCYVHSTDPEYFFYEEHIFYEGEVSVKKTDADEEYYDMQISLGASMSLNIFFIMDDRDYITAIYETLETKSALATYTYEKSNIIQAYYGARYATGSDKDVYKILTGTVEEYLLDDESESVNMVNNFEYDDAGRLIYQASYDYLYYYNPEIDFDYVYDNNGMRTTINVSNSYYSGTEIKYVRNEEGLVIRVVFSADYFEDKIDISYGQNGCFILYY